MRNYRKELFKVAKLEKLKKKCYTPRSDNIELFEQQYVKSKFRVLQIL